VADFYAATQQPYATAPWPTIPPPRTLYRVRRLQHRFKRDVEVHRARRSALREFAGAHNMLVERVRAGNVLRPFYDRFERRVGPPTMFRLRYHCGSMARFGSSPKLDDSLRTSVFDMPGHNR
jgi:hypothetical protein